LGNLAQGLGQQLSNNDKHYQTPVTIYIQIWSKVTNLKNGGYIECENTNMGKKLVHQFGVSNFLFVMSWCKK
jgi:hypothetical protein